MRGMVDGLRIGASALLLVAAPTMMVLASVPQSGQAAVLFDPALNDRDVLVRVASAGATFVRFGEAPGLVVVDLPEAGPQALRGAGAWLVLDPLLLGGCRLDVMIDEGRSRHDAP